MNGIEEIADPQGELSVVASCDIYDFSDGMIRRIASYNIALDNA
jgi:hypothetical protein